MQPSDARAKRDIEECDTAQQLKNVQNIRVVRYSYEPQFAMHSGLGGDAGEPRVHTDTGVIAQEVKRVLPEAVKEAGDVILPNGDTIDKFLVVNKVSDGAAARSIRTLIVTLFLFQDRIFMENVGAVKELCKVTGNLENRIDQLEKINRKLCKINSLQRRDSTSTGQGKKYYLLSHKVRRPTVWIRFQRARGARLPRITRRPGSRTRTTTSAPDCPTAAAGNAPRARAFAATASRSTPTSTTATR